MSRGLIVLAAVALAFVLLLHGGDAGAPSVAAPSPAAPVATTTGEARLDGEAAPDAEPHVTARTEVVHDPLAEAGARTPLVGVVVDAERGTPIEGAEVALTLGEHTERVTTDAAGDFELEWPDAWGGRLEVAHPNYVDLRRPTIERGAPLRVALGRSGRVTGQVLAGAGQDLGGATAQLWITYSGRTSSDALREQPLGPGEEFAFEDLAAGTYALGVSTLDAPVAYEPQVLVRAGLETRVLVNLAAGERFRGQVLTRDERAAVEGARVLARPELQGVGGDVERDAERRAETGGDGRFELEGLTAGELELWIRTPWGGLDFEKRWVTADGVPEEETFFVPGPARLAGHVRDADGEPAAGAWVALSSEQEARRFPWARIGSMLEVEHGGLRIVRTDGEGRFDLGDVPARERLQLGAYPSGGETGDVFGAFARRIELDEGEEREVELTLVPATTLAGRVVDPEAAPVAGATIEVEIDAGADRSFLAEALTDGAGQYRFERVPALRVRVEADLEGFRGTSTWVDLRDAEDGVAPDLVLRPASTVRGHVVDTEGWAVPYARVRVADPRADERDRRARSDTADAYGRFEVEGLADGDYIVEAWALGHRLPAGAAPRVTLPGEPYVVLRMAPREVALPGTITGEVVLAGTGGPVPGLELRGTRGTVLLEGSRFRVTGVPPGRTRLSARAPNRESIVFDEVVVPEGGTVDVGRYETRSTVRVRVVVLSEGGQALTRASVRLYRRVKEPAHGVYVPRAYTLDLDRRRGWYEQGGVGRYEWTLDVRHEGYERYTEPVRVSDDAVEVRLRRSEKGKGGG